MKTLRQLTALALALILPVNAQTIRTLRPDGGGMRPADRTPFMDALGVTPLGKASLTRPTPAGPRFVQLNSDGTETLLDAAGFKTAIGATTAAWGNVTGTLASQTDLKTALDGKGPGAVPINARFVAEGDSLTAATGGNGQASWTDYVSTLENFRGRAAVSKVAISGSTYATMIARYSSTVFPLRPTAGEPVYLFTLIGYNDGAVSIPTWISALEGYWTTAESDGFTTVAIIAPPYAVNSNVLNMAEAIRASGVPDIVCDLGAVFRNSTDQNFWLGDNTHPREGGARLIAKAVNDALNNLPRNHSSQVLVQGGGGIGVNTQNPRAIADLVGAQTLMLSNNKTPNSQKLFDIMGAPYGAVSDTPPSYIGGRTESNENILYLGRGTTANYMSTSIRFYTGANATTPGGGGTAWHGNLSSAGRWTFGTLAQNGGSSAVNVVESGATIRLSQTSGSTNTAAAFFGLPPGDGNIIGNSLAGELVIASPSGSGIAFGTNTTGVGQTLRMRLSDVGNLSLTSGDISTETVGKTLKVKSGSNSKAGTFTLASGAATVANTSLTANSVVYVTLKTASGTRSGNPDIIPTASTGFTAAGAATDNSTYNYVILEVN